MIEKTEKGYVVKDKNGKVLSRPYPTERMAKAREHQDEFLKRPHKHKAEKRKSNRKGTK